MQNIIAQLAQEIKIRPAQVEAAVQLLDGGATVPFIARYRKEVTDGLDDIQLRELEARLDYLRELRDRKEAVIRAIEEQGKLTPALTVSIHNAATKQEVEDIYLPFKLKRRTKGQLAKEAGLDPLADALFAHPTLNPQQPAEAYVVPMRPVVEG
ncbi:MAG: RNA-binding transcriptional accessory protein, partial [Candidatus Saccharibacteria bacterium]|nr:RNA-binding transcriptional accessory protein [Rhodoferax sp.]